MRYLLIKNGKVIRDGGIFNEDLLILENRISEVAFQGELPKNCTCIDAAGMYVSPGFIDLHLHGGGGYDVMDCTEEAFANIAETHLQNGSTTIVPTAVSAGMDRIMQLIDVFKSAADKCPTLYGLHLEGPYISAKQRGAHKEKYLHAPTTEETAALIDRGRGIIKRITAAPELDNMAAFSKAMTDNGIALCLGHSDATSDIAAKAFGMGFSHITHLYSATPSVRKIGQEVKAGVIEAAYLNDSITVELIADGKHAAVDALKLAVKIKGPGRTALVTDALRCTGTAAKESWLGEQKAENKIIIEDGVAKLPDRSSFAGSIATAATLLEKGIKHYGLSVTSAVTMLTETPARILGIKDKGRIAPRFLADLVLFDENYAVQKVLLNGSLVK